MWGPVFVLSGQLAAGKSTVARALLAEFAFGYHIDVDGIREMVTSGRASPLEWSDETARQFELALAGSIALARVYAAAGFAVAIEGAVEPAAVDRHLAGAGMDGARIIRVSLEPELAVALRRNHERATKGFDTTILDDAIRQVDGDLRRETLPAGWHRIDNGHESLTETTRRILLLLRDS